MNLIFMPFMLSLIILNIFYLLSYFFYINFNQISIFECGYKSYFFSRFSFSVHFFFISLIFLFLDLEICITFVMILEELSNKYFTFILFFFVTSLLTGLFLEWKEKKLDWFF